MKSPVVTFRMSDQPSGDTTEGEEIQWLTGWDHKYLDLVRDPGREECPCCYEPRVISWRTLARRWTEHERLWQDAPEEEKSPSKRRRLLQSMLEMLLTKLQTTDSPRGLVSELLYSLRAVDRGQSPPLFDPKLNETSAVLHIKARAGAALQMGIEEGRKTSVWARAIASKLGKSGFTSPSGALTKKNGHYDGKAVQYWRNASINKLPSELGVAYMAALLFSKAEGLSAEEALDRLSAHCREHLTPAIKDD